MKTKCIFVVAVMFNLIYLSAQNFQQYDILMLTTNAVVKIKKNSLNQYYRESFISLDTEYKGSFAYDPFRNKLILIKGNTLKSMSADGTEKNIVTFPNNQTPHLVAADDNGNLFTFNNQSGLNYVDKCGNIIEIDDHNFLSPFVTPTITVLFYHKDTHSLFLALTEGGNGFVLFKLPLNINNEIIAPEIQGVGGSFGPSYNTPIAISYGPRECMITSDGTCEPDLSKPRSLLIFGDTNSNCGAIPEPRIQKIDPFTLGNLEVYYANEGYGANVVLNGIFSVLDGCAMTDCGCVNSGEALVFHWRNDSSDPCLLGTPNAKKYVVKAYPSYSFNSSSDGCIGHNFPGCNIPGLGSGLLHAGLTCPFQPLNAAVGNPMLQIVSPPGNTTDTDGDGLYDFVEEQIATDPFQWDTDEDGIGDKEEYCGIDIDSDGAIDYRLPNTHPTTKDIYVEVDAMISREPSSNALQMVVNAFADHEIYLHILNDNYPTADVDDIERNAINWGDSMVSVWEKFDEYKTLFFGTESERGTIQSVWLNSKRRAAKKRYVRYCIFGHTYEFSNSSGIARDLASHDFMVTLGAWDFVNDTIQAGTFMHELGHSLGLHHGGFDAIQGKPNYISIMNYVWQVPLNPSLNSDDCSHFDTIQMERVRNSWHLNYSEATLDLLIESNLDEAAILGNNSIYDGFFVPVGPDTPQVVQMNYTVDWNRDGIFTTADSVNVNSFGDCTINEYLSSPYNESLYGQDDWSSLDFSLPDNYNNDNLPTPLAGVRGCLEFGIYTKLSTLTLDCNGNKVPDFEDIELGTSNDIDKDGVPDECEHPDQLFDCAGLLNTDEDLFCDLMDNCPDVANDDQEDNDNDGIGNVCDPTPDGGVLPVELISFWVVGETNCNLLKWETVNEFENLGFQVLHSSDAIRWKEIGWVNAMLNANNTYKFVHSSPVLDRNYYRLNQKDFDGNETLSEIKFIDFKDDNINNISLVPNPNTGTFSIQNASPGDCFIVTDLRGRIVMENEISNLNEKFHLGYLPENTYILRITRRTDTITKKMIVL